MDIEEIIEKIVDNGRVEDMEALSNILEDLMELIQKYDPDCYKEYEIELYKMAFGNVIDKKMAENIVEKMRPFGMRWNIHETSQLQDQYGLNDIRKTDFFVVINSAYNDYRDIFGEDIEGYIKYTVDFIRDEDAKSDKVFLYFTTLAE